MFSLLSNVSHLLFSGKSEIDTSDAQATCLSGKSLSGAALGVDAANWLHMKQQESCSFPLVEHLESFTVNYSPLMSHLFSFTELAHERQWV